MRFRTKLLSFLTLLAVLTAICVCFPYGAMGAEADTLRPKLIPGGRPFGIKFFMKGVAVIGVTDIETYDGLTSPAKDAGIKKGDFITKINGKELTDSDELSRLINDSKGEKTVFTLKRGDDYTDVDVYPVRSSSDGLYKTGLWVRDSTAGIGTITYVNAESSSFGGLGHGVCDTETGRVLPLHNGVITNVTVTDVVKGLENEPGEIRGEFSSYKAGTLDKNTECGVFGTLYDISSFTSEPMEICYSSEMKTGKAYILTTISGDVPSLFEVNITKINRKSGKTKNFTIEVTDKTLLAKTGGIVQGMSGSPVIQNGRLCGAVTHVMINDPKRGYGIFIENMLDAAEE